MAKPNKIESEANAERIRAYYRERGWEIAVEVRSFGGGDYAAQILDPIRFCSTADMKRYNDYAANVVKARHWAIKE